MKHPLKGPWTLEMEWFGDDLPHHIPVSADGHMGFAQVVWVMEDDARMGKKSPDCEARARLLVAAPLLLEALQAGPNTVHTYPSGEECKCSQCEFVRLRNAAILAATGEPK